MTSVRNLALSAAMLFSTAAWSANPTDLLTLYHDALREDPQFSSARSVYQAAQQAKPLARSLLLPSVSLGANYDHTDVDVDLTKGAPFPGGRQDFNGYGYALNVVQPIYRRPSLIGYQASELVVEQGELALAQAQQHLIERLAVAYVEVLLANDSLTLARAQKAAIAEQQAFAKRNFELGRSKVTDVNEAQARYDLIVAHEIAAANTLELRLRGLSEFVSSPPSELATLPDAAPLTLPQPTDINIWLALAERQNLAIRQATLDVDLAQKELDKARAAWQPTVDLVAGYADSRSDGGVMGFGMDARGPNIGLRIGMPIYSGGAISAKAQEAAARYAAARQSLDGTRRSAVLSTREAYLGVVSGLAQVAALQQALISTQSTVDSTRLGLEVGVRTNVDVLNAQQQLFSAKRDLAEARYRVLLSHLQLAAAVGSLNEASVVQANMLLRSF